MKKQAVTLVIGIVIGAMLFGGFAFAKNLQETATLWYNDIKIMLDGSEIITKDVNGNIIEPFIIDGTTYLPVRGLNESMGNKVDWDANSSTVTIERGGINSLAYALPYEVNSVGLKDYNVNSYQVAQCLGIQYVLRETADLWTQGHGTGAGAIVVPPALQRADLSNIIISDVNVNDNISDGSTEITFNLTFTTSTVHQDPGDPEYVNHAKMLTFTYLGYSWDSEHGIIPYYSRYLLKCVDGSSD